MKHLPHDDPRAVELVRIIQAGAVEKLARRLREEPDLIEIGIVDEHKVSRTLLHVTTDWPGHFPRVADSIRLLVQAGVDVDSVAIKGDGPSDSPETPLHWAASSDDLDALEALLDLGANIEAPGAVITGGTPMSDAVIFRKWKAAARLLERGAETTWWQAAALGLLDRVQAWFEGEPSPTAEEVTRAFWSACRGGQLETARWLRAKGGDPEWVGGDGKNAVDTALEGKQHEVVAWLRAGAEV